MQNFHGLWLWEIIGEAKILTNKKICCC
uniref:Uncharacterized protein n=1 Tax=Moniliophthora roreri TaxID=221103 RepID=A0A0W0FX47_MONRR